METILHLQGNTSSHLTPLILIHPISGLALPYLALGELSQDGQRPIYGINSPIYAKKSYHVPSSLDELAVSYVRLVQDIQPQGPYLLGGWSMGGMIAIRMAAILEMSNERIIHIVLIDSINPDTVPPFQSAQEHQNLVSLTYNRLIENAGALRRPTFERSSSSSSLSDSELSSSGKYQSHIALTEITSLSDSSAISSRWTSQVNLVELQHLDGMPDQNYEEDSSNDDSDGGTYNFHAAENLLPLEVLTRMSKHVADGLKLIADTSRSCLPTSISAPVTLFKCSVLEKLPSIMPETRRQVIRANFTDPRCGWKLPRLQTLSLKSAHDRVFDPEHVSELSFGLRALLVNCA